jgi:hypothetical protein
MSIGLLQVVAPFPTNLSHETSPINVDDEEKGNIGDDSEPEEVTPTTAKGKRHREWERNLR